MPSASAPPTRPSRSRRLLAALVGSAALAALLPLAAAGSAAAAAPICTAPAKHAAVAAKLSRDIKSALSGRSDQVGISVYDQNTGVFCTYNAYTHFDSASVVKAAIMGTVLRRAQEQHRGLTSWESSNLRAMITHSDNTAATNLWNSVGRTRFQAFLNLAQMHSTHPGSGDLWGLTQITARDEVHLLDAFTDHHDALNATWRAYALKLMSQVTPSQRWGVPYGAPGGTLVSNKNGWLPRATHGWRVHSIGTVTGNGRDYRLAVLTQNNSTMSYGETTIERVALAVHRDLGGSTTRAAAVSTRAADVPAPTDGSAPF
ncbi:MULTISPECIES: serine hydrolase [Streptacidiphilus]|uniref:Beta-lactamase n=1 Tax=Streptacidiphilus cavernicola TaxID=3342716 RepID=A0ABV6UUJ9_9ACTN|nr:serine hydrolase [Streptacidiphilus jeojiense]